MEDRIYKIYCHTNLINNKKYIGQTSLPVEKRWLNGNGYKYNKNFFEDIQLYGWYNFKHEVLFDILTKQEANNLEKFYIKSFNLTDTKFGYNNQEGGSHGKMSNETKKKISKSNKGKPKSEKAKINMRKAKKGKCEGIDNSFYGKRHSEMSKIKMSNARKGKYIGKNHPCYGRKLTQEDKEKLSQRNKALYIGENNPNAKKCMCLETNEIFLTLKDASIRFNTSISHISNVCNNRQKTTQGLHFKFV